ncbi:MAG: D-ribose pyranase [Spirochaetaceae bacterium]
MKRHGVLNQPLSSVVAGMGHTDSLVIADAGLPIPQGPERIDLAVRCGVPPFIETLKALLEELEVERAVVARETKEKSPQVHEEIRALLGAVEIQYVDHEELKSRTSDARAVVRTGECTPFSNVILYSGVTF